MCDQEQPFNLWFGFPVPGSVAGPDGWRLIWRGCAVMGILNLTPDSFSDGGEHQALDSALTRAQRMRQAGVLMVDIGGESTRPGAAPVDSVTELDRVLPLLQALRGSGLLISIDTRKPEVADAALKAGAHLVNDVTALTDPQMVQVCAEHRAPACLMHMQGEPRTMQEAPQYGDVLAEVYGFLRQRAAQVKAAGVPAVLLDPGIGFGKTLEHNLTLLRHLDLLTSGEDPVLIGASRKKLIDWLAQVPKASERDPGSLALHLHAARQGAALVRAHAAEQHVQALRVWQGLQRGKP